MIDLTPLDVRKKSGDFKRLMRGYDPQEVDVFLELVAERLEGLVRENIQLKERTQTLQQQVTSQLGREQAVQDALVTAQELRADIRAQSQREAEHVMKEAETEAKRMIAEAEAEVRSKLRGVERRVEGAGDALVELERRRARFLKEFRQLLEREMDVVVVEEERTPLEERAIELDLGPTSAAGPMFVPGASDPASDAEEVTGAEEANDADDATEAADATDAEAGDSSDTPPGADASPDVDAATDDTATIDAPLDEGTGAPSEDVLDVVEEAPDAMNDVAPDAASDGVPEMTPPAADETSVVDGIDLLPPEDDAPGQSAEPVDHAEPTDTPVTGSPAAPEAEVSWDVDDTVPIQRVPPAKPPRDDPGSDLIDASIATPVSGGDGPREVVTAPDFGSEQLSVSPDFSASPLPTELETPSFAIGAERPLRPEERGEPVDELSASMEAEAMAEAQSQVVEVTGADGDRLSEPDPLSEVPRLEEVLAEAGAEFVDVTPERTRPAAGKEIAPPRLDTTDGERHVLYLDPDESDKS